MRAQRGSKGIINIFSLNSTLDGGWAINDTIRPLYPRVVDLVLILQEAGLAPGPVWTGAENLSLTGIRYPHLPARSESLYRLSCQGFWIFSAIEGLGVAAVLRKIP